MKLIDIIHKTKETKEQFLDRTYWNCGTWDEPKVFVFFNKKDIHDPEAKIEKIISVNEAKRYLDSLGSEAELRNGGKENGNRLESDERKVRQIGQRCTKEDETVSLETTGTVQIHGRREEGTDKVRSDLRCSDGGRNSAGRRRSEGMDNNSDKSMRETETIDRESRSSREADYLRECINSRRRQEYSIRDQRAFGEIDRGFCGHDYELIKVEEEELGYEPDTLSFLCPMCGEKVHEVKL